MPHPSGLRRQPGAGVGAASETASSYQTISANGGGINSTVRATRESSEARLLALAQQRLDRLLREGVTTLEIKSGYGLDLENERKMLRVARQLAQKQCGRAVADAALGSRHAAGI